MEEASKTKETAPEPSKEVIPITEDVEGVSNGPITRVATTPPAQLTELDKGLIAWNSLHDPENPLYWPRGKRILNMTLISCLTFISPLGSSIFAPGIEATLADLHTSSRAVGSLMVTIFLLGYCLGPLFLAPLSEIYGRKPVIIISSWLFNFFLLGCSFVQNMPGLIVLRFLAGTAGSAVMNLAPAIVADIYPIERRSFAMGIVLIVQSVSPAAGPMCGGFISQRLSWRWVYWILLMGSGVITILSTFWFHECYAPVILERKTKKLSKELKREDLRSKLALQVTGKELLKVSLIRPLKLLTRSPIAFLTALYVATIYGILYLLLTTVNTIFVTQYGFSTEISGLTFIGFAIGMIFALLILMNTQDKTVARLRAKNNGVFEPEMRLVNLVYVGGWVGPALFMYGWSAEYRVHWIVPIIALFLYGFGQVAIFMGTQTYVVDSFPKYAASAVAAVSCLRSLVGTFLVSAQPFTMSSSLTFR
jgi:multidrug resistance protein